MEGEKEEKLVLSREGKKKRRKNVEVEKVKWLWVILHDNLEFDSHWKGWITQACKMLGALNGIGNSQWGVSSNSWQSAYTGMICTITTWGAEIWWRGQHQWKEQMQKL